MIRAALTICMLFLAVYSVSAQQPPAPPAMPRVSQEPRSSELSQAPQPSAVQSSIGRQWTTIEIVLSAAILLFTVIVLGIQAILIARARVPWAPQSILRANGLILVIAAGLFLITAGYSSDQVSPVMGLLGTVAGYLLGSGEKATKTA